MPLWVALFSYAWPKMKILIMLMAAFEVAPTCSFVSTTLLKGSCTILRQSSSTSSSSQNSRRSSYSSNKGQRKKQQTRNRGANAANHNRRGHEFRLNKDGTGRKQRSRKMNTKRPPRWEREGDNLYQEVSKQNEHLQFLKKKRVSSAQDVCDVLAPWMTSTSSKHDNNSDDDTVKPLVEKEKPSEKKRP